MRTLRFVGILACGVLAALLSVHTAPVSEAAQPATQQDNGENAPDPATVEAIDAEFQREIRALEVRRLGRLADLAARQQGDEAAATYEDYFRRALDAELFAEAEPVAERVIEAGEAPAVVTWLAHVVNIIAEADRGAYRESLDSLIAAVRADGEDDDVAPAVEVLPLEARLKLQEAYFQRLVRTDQYASAREAFTVLRDNAQDPALSALAASRLRQLELVGQPAPPIRGEGVDGQPIDLADDRGDVVLVVFWASWCLPNAAQAQRLDQLLDTYADQGLRVLGVNVDALDESVTSVESVLPGIRRFLIDHNVTWPNLVDRPADDSIAASYAVTDLPTSVVVGRDGTVRGLILSGDQLERKTVEALQAPTP